MFSYDHIRAQLLHVRTLAYSILAPAAVLGYAALSSPPASIDLAHPIWTLTSRYEAFLKNIAGKPFGELFWPCREAIRDDILPALRRQRIDVDSSFDNMGCHVRWNERRSVSTDPTIADAVALMGSSQSFELIVPIEPEVNASEILTWAGDRHLLLVDFVHDSSASESSEQVDGIIRLRDRDDLGYTRDFGATWKWRKMRARLKAYSPLSSMAVRYYWDELRSLRLYEFDSWRQMRHSFPEGSVQTDIWGLPVVSGHVVFVGPAFVVLGLVYMIGHLRNLLRLVSLTAGRTGTPVADFSPWLGAAQGVVPKAISTVMLILPAFVVLLSVKSLQGSWMVASGCSLACLALGIYVAQVGARLGRCLVVLAEKDTGGTG